MPRALVALIVLVVCLAAAACGGGDDDSDERPLTREAYLHEMRSIESDSGAAVRLFSELVSRPYSREECAEKAERFHEALEKILERVEELRPPADVDELHARFLVAARESVDRIGELADEVEDGDVHCGDEYNRQAYGMPSTRRAERILAEYANLGYTIGLNAGQ